MYNDFLAKVLEPDTVLPEQFYGKSGLSRQLEGEKRLMLAVLRDAVECLEKYRGVKMGAPKELYQDALSWIEDRSTEWFFCFNNICDLLELDPDYLREFLLKREYHLSKSALRGIYGIVLQDAE